jgi:hypothetical protein
MHPEPEDLRRMPLFAALTDAERRQAATWFEIQEHDAGERIVHEGSSGYGFFVLDEGEVRIEPMFGTHFRQMQSSMPSVEAGIERPADARLARPAQPA